MKQWHSFNSLLYSLWHLLDFPQSVNSGKSIFLNMSSIKPFYKAKASSGLSYFGTDEIPESHFTETWKTPLSQFDQIKSSNFAEAPANSFMLISWCLSLKCNIKISSRDCSSLVWTPGKICWTIPLILSPFRDLYGLVCTGRWWNIFRRKFCLSNICIADCP